MYKLRGLIVLERESCCVPALLLCLEYSNCYVHVEVSSMKNGTRLWLIRHGETHWNREGRMQGHEDVELSERGEEQAHKLADRLEGRHFAAIYTSDLERASRTAEILAAKVELEPSDKPELREVHVGELGGLTLEEAVEQFPNYFAGGFDHRQRRPGGESHMDHMERVWPAVTEIAEAHPGERVLIVCHGGSIRAAMKRALGLADDYHLRVTVGNTSITVLHRRHDEWYLALMNDTIHLGEVSF
jgi:broad specificity phosphatase PhoE